MENSYKSHDIEIMFTKILGKLERIEEKLDESSYPPKKLLNQILLNESKLLRKRFQKANVLISTAWMIS